MEISLLTAKITMKNYHVLQCSLLCIRRLSILKNWFFKYKKVALCVYISYTQTND